MVGAREHPQMSTHVLLAELLELYIYINIWNSLKFYNLLICITMCVNHEHPHVWGGSSKSTFFQRCVSVSFSVLKNIESCCYKKNHRPDCNKKCIPYLSRWTSSWCMVYPVATIFFWSAGNIPLPRLIRRCSSLRIESKQLWQAGNL